MQQLPTRTNVGPFGAPWWALMIAAAIYVVSPIDFIPEFPLGCIGVVDDIGMVGFGIYCFVKLLSGGGMPAAPVHAAQAARTVTVEPEKSWSSEPRIVTAIPQRQAPVAPTSAAGRTAVFVVQVIDDDGTEQRVEVEARDAEHARACVSALGADGRIGKVFLKRMLGDRQASDSQLGGPHV